MEVDRFQFFARDVRPPPTLLQLLGSLCGFMLHREASCAWVMRWDFGERCAGGAEAVCCVVWCLSLLASTGLGRALIVGQTTLDLKNKQYYKYVSGRNMSHAGRYV